MSAPILRKIQKLQIRDEGNENVDSPLQEVVQHEEDLKISGERPSSALKDHEEPTATLIPEIQKSLDNEIEEILEQIEKTLSENLEKVTAADEEKEENQHQDQNQSIETIEKEFELDMTVESLYQQKDTEVINLFGTEISSESGKKKTFISYFSFNNITIFRFQCSNLPT